MRDTEFAPWLSARTLDGEIIGRTAGQGIGYAEVRCVFVAGPDLQVNLNIDPDAKVPATYFFGTRERRLAWTVAFADGASYAFELARMTPRVAIEVRELVGLYADTSVANTSAAMVAATLHWLGVTPPDQAFCEMRKRLDEVGHETDAFRWTE